MKILLVAPNRVRTPFPVYPLGIDYVAAALETRHQVEVVDLGPSDSHGPFLEALETFRPDLIGISVRNVDNTEANAPRGFIDDIESLVQFSRQRTHAPVVLGGAGYSLFPAEILNRVGADYGIVGEGERVVDLVNAIERGEDVRRIPSVVVSNRQGGASDTSSRLPKVELWRGGTRRSIPRPTQLDYYLRTGGMVNLQTKRGCPYRCSYCTYPLIEGRELRLFHPDEVAAEWVALIAAGAKFLFVTDSVFNSDPEHNLAVAAALEKRGARTPWGAFFAPTRFPEGYFERMAATGLSHVEFGTESMSAPMLRSYRKPFTVDLIEAAHALTQKHGLHVAHYIMLGGPGETLATAAETLDRCERLPGPAAFFFFCGVRIYPRTALFETAVAQGQIAEQESLLDARFYCSPEATPEALERLVRDRKHANWVVGSGSPMMVASMRRMYGRGAIGPLWEKLATVPPSSR